MAAESCRPLGDRRVLVAYGVDKDQQSRGTSFVLPHPRNGRPQAYLLVGGQLQEVQHFKQMYSCWVIDNNVLADGGAYVSTPVDVLYVLLPFLEQGQSKGSVGVFCSLDQLLSDDAPAALQGLMAAAGPLLRCICDTKEAGGDTFYRLSHLRVLAWLSCKVRQTQAALQGAGVLSNMDDAAQCAYAVELLAEYLPDKWSSALASHLNIQESATNTGGALLPLDIDNLTPSAKRVKMDPKEAARELARKRAAEAKQSQMAKQAAGTKKISAFFGLPKKPATVEQPAA